MERKKETDRYIMKKGWHSVKCIAPLPFMSGTENKKGSSSDL
jgi:hypothetical protein